MSTDGARVKPDADFRRDFRRSQDTTEKVCEWLRGLGFDCDVKPSELTPNSDVRWQYVDSGDIEVKQRFEVKHRKESFTKESFPYASIIVDEVYKVDKYPLPTLYAYLIVSADMKCVAVITSKSKPHWFKQKKYDHAQRRECEFYFIPKEYATFMDFH